MEAMSGSGAVGTMAVGAKGGVNVAISKAPTFGVATKEDGITGCRLATSTRGLASGAKRANRFYWASSIALS